MNLMTPKLLAVLKELIAKDDLVKFYKSKEWRSIRAVAIKRDKECVRCKFEGKQHRVQIVHHIKEVKDCPELALTLNNLMSLCNSCHNKEHNKFNHKPKPKKIINEEQW